MKNRWKNIDELVGRLTNLLWTQRSLSGAGGLLKTLGIVIIALLAMTLFSAIAVLPVWFKVLTLSATALAALYLLFTWAAKPLLADTVDNLAGRLEKRYSDLKGRLIAAVQFQRGGVSTQPGVSSELVDLNAKQTIAIADQLDLHQSLDYSSLRRSLPNLGVAATLVALFVIFAPNWFSHAYRVYSQPLTEVAPPLGYQAYATPDGGKAIKYRDLELTGALVGVDFPGDAEIHYRFEGGRWQSEKFDLRKIDKVKLNAGDSLAFSTRLREVKRSLEFYVTAGRRQTETHSIEVVDLPRVADIALSIVPPKYTGLKPTQLTENSGTFAALIGSQVRIEATVNTPLAEAALEFEDGSTTPMTLAGLKTRADLKVDANTAYRFRLVDSLGETNPDPIDYYVTAIEDRDPEVTVLSPGDDIDIDESMLIPMKVRISDDFGFSSLAMQYKIVTDAGESGETVMVIHYSENITTDGEIEFTWDMDKLNMEPGDYVSYFFEVRDNDQISGPKVGLSKTYIARLPSVEELIAQLDEESRTRVESTEELLKREKDLAERMKETQRKLQEMKDTEKPDWQKQQSMQELADTHKELMDQIDKMAEDMREQIEQHQGSPLMNQEILDKLKRIQELYQEVATDEMRDAQKKLDEALKSMDKDQLEDALKENELTQEELMNRLERTLELLKRMQVEQKMNAMSEQAKELLDRQIRNNERTMKKESEELAEIAPDEDKVTEGVEDLKKQAEELEKLLEEAKMDQSPEAKQFADAVKRSDVQKDTEEMSDKLREGSKEESSNSGSSAEKKLKSMLDEMRQSQQAMNGQQSGEQNAALRRAIEDATYLSREQEGLLNETADLNSRSTALRDKADEQSVLRESVAGFGDRLVKLSKENPFLSSELRTIVQDALYNIDESVERLNETRGSQAAGSQRESMKKINDVALALLQSMEEQSQCNKGGSCDKAGQNMESLGERQSKLNRDTQRGLNEIDPNDPSQAERLRELAGEQEAIKKSMEQLQKEFGNRQEVLGDLDAIAKEMEKVIEELADGTAGEETTERQLRIHSRMLESVKALSRRDFTPERQARVGNDFFRSSPSPLSDDADTRPFEDRLQDFLKEGFPPEYEQQVRNYFKALNNMSQPGAGK